MMKRLNQSLALLIVIFSLSCGNQNKSTTTSENENPAENEVPSESTDKQIDAVCIWDKLSLRETPDGKGKYLTSVSIGETVTYLNQSAVDSSDNRTYLKIRLLDGKEGWSLEDFIIQNSTAAVFTDEAEVYNRPDLLTKANKKYSSMDIVAVKQENGDWLEVTGKRSEGKYIETGWIKNNSISTDEVDIAVAKFAKTALAVKDENEKFKAITEIVENPDLKSSAFIPMLRDKIIESQEIPEEDFEDVAIDGDSSDIM